MNLIKTPENIQNKIFSIREKQVMLDFDLAEIYGVETKRLNEQVKRNINRFPESFRFQLIDYELIELVANCDRFVNLKHSTNPPFAFTEQGVAMLSAMLRSTTAVKISIQIIEAFVKMRTLVNGISGLYQRIELVEKKQLNTDIKFEQLFNALENNKALPAQGIFFENQVFDAYLFVSKLVKSAEQSVKLIDNYIDETVLTMLSKRNKNVTAIIYTKTINKKLALDLQKHNSQHEQIKIVQLTNVHDRFLIIDNKDAYHFGASLKDLGKKWFAFSKMNQFTEAILKKLPESTL